MNRCAVPRRGALLGAGAVLALVAGCSTSSGVESTAAEPIPSTTEPAPTTIPEPNGDGAEVFRRTSPSIAFVQTALGSGTAEMIEDGYLVTNAHVVDPFASVDIEFPGRRRLEDVPVVGVDLMADIAVLGPIDDGPPALELVGAADYPRGSAVFLVGHPAARSSDLDLTITSGVLSRRQHLSDLDLTLLQTDALIAGGQSGGALLDEDGRFIGVSGLFFSGFAFALDGAGARNSIDHIVAGQSSPYRPIDDGLQTTISAPLGPEVRALTAVLPPLDEPTLLRITATSDGGGEMWVTVSSYHGFSASTLEGDDESGGLLAAVGEDSWEVLLPERDAVIVEIGTVDDGPTDATLTTSLGIVPYVDDEPWQMLELGTPASSIDAVLDAFENIDTFTVDLVEGTPVTITVRSLLSDLAFEISALEGEDSLMVDDGPGDAGWWGLDPSTMFTPALTGTYRIDVQRAIVDRSSSGYRISVSSPG
ncbi:MAG: S1C family serine protease [Acidimicrobiia bacterium]